MLSDGAFIVTVSVFSYCSLNVMEESFRLTGSYSCQFVCMKLFMWL